MSKKKTTEEFIKDARKVHGDKYDYSNVEYVNSKTKVCIICPEHGEFWQIPNGHLNSQGCPNCGIKKAHEKNTSTKEDFIKKAREAHGDKYDYTKVNYMNNSTKVCIICPEHDHGEFWQTPNSHTQGNGCPKCKGDKTRERCTSTKERFIKKANEIHKGKYDYSKVEYVKSNIKVCIICPEHGEFWQVPSYHTQGNGCPKCGRSYVPTTEEWIVSARKVHGDKYDYSNAHYVDALTKITIRCPKHGEFEQTPSSHLSGRGCPECGRLSIGISQRLSSSDFIKKAKEVHGKKYEYSEVNYVNSQTKVCIICNKPNHGEFWQTPSAHLQGQGCPKCANESNGGRKRLSISSFIKKAREVHGDKYDYSKVEYDGAHTKVCIICPEHGEFWQTPNEHKKGCGCPKCVNRCVYTTEEWIISARKVHGDKYVYSKVEYVNSSTKVCIICSEHGEFWQIPSDHLSNHGCPKCKGDKTRERLTSSREEFIEKAHKVHGDKYDYSNVNYVNNKTKVCIKCPEHGEFWQVPSDHTQGAGCPKCNLSHLEWSVMNYLDEHEIAYDYQKRFKWFGRQSLDFYLPEYKVGIECQGKQHFFPVERFGGDKGFKQTLERDKRKKALCEKHGVKLLYYSNLSIKYPYDVFEDLDLLFKEIKN